MNDANWVYLDSDTIDRDVNKEHRKLIGGVDVLVRLSPYDVPIAMRSTIDRDHNRAKLEFRYIGSDESLDVIPVSDDMDVLLGKTSRRLYAISVDRNLLSHASSSQQIESSFENAFRKLQSLSLKHLRPENYTAAKKAMAAKTLEVFPLPNIFAAAH